MCFRFGGKHKKEGTRKSKNKETRFKAQENPLNPPEGGLFALCNVYQLIYNELTFLC
jgi:hypothetical protein